MREQFKSFLDDIAGVLFSPMAALKKISEEKKVAQSLIVLILSSILPEIAGIRHSLNESILGTFAGRDALPGMDVAHGALTRAVPYIAALMITGAILIIPLVHFIFTAVVELACQFLMPRHPRPAAFVDKSARQEDAGQSHDGGAAVSDAGDAEDNEKNSTLRIQGESCVLSAPASGVGLFAAMAFSTLPMLFMVPVNLLSALAGKNLGLVLGIPLRIWVMVLQIISVRQTHGFTAGRAALAYFALPAAAVVAALVFAIFLAALLAPYIPMLP
ncbi:MAG: hypothetical protein NUV45_05360 [Tepidanaerobacteraceae bacterium]|jgi:hypothetical protein|nr:hypothetical protein [Tepidanaerobacteraceae bacterium]